MKVIILGAGGHGCVVADILLAMRDAGQAVEPLGFLDDAWQVGSSPLPGLKVLGGVDALAAIPHDACIVAIGDNQARLSWYERLKKNNERLATAIHPTAHVSPSASVGEGAMVCAGAVVNPLAKIEAGVILNTGCSVDHHNTIHDHAHIAPGARLAGTVTVGRGTLVGVGASVLPGMRIGSWSVVGAGAVVIRDVPDHTTVAGIPAVPIDKA